MEELDLLKKSWKKDNQKFEQVSESQIYKMIHRISSSNVKWILIISILEFVAWTSISLCFNTDDYFKKLHAESFITFFKILNVINYAIIFWFIYKFYKNYVKISTTTSTKQLMTDILNTRKTVQYYVVYNLSMITISMILGFILAYLYNPKFDTIKFQIAHDNYGVLFKMIGIFGGILFVFVFGFWLFYKLLYGILLRKLRGNYNELKKIE
ncbi:MAG TPA: hypothetical protein PLP39_04520 [Flavobacterium lutivivi]|nr:hypothetical protein [Flavobacterium lutivivi]